MSQELNFRSALSGYNRDDVEAYVDQVNNVMNTYKQQLNDAMQAKDQLQTDWLNEQEARKQAEKETEDLRQQLADANSEIARLTVQNEVTADVASGMLGDSLDAEPSGKDHDLMEMQKNLTELRTALGRAKAAVEADARSLQQKDEQIYNLNQMIEQYKADALSYQATCANLGLIEMEARSRMAQEKKRADTENQAQRAKTEQYCRDLLARTKEEAAKVELDTQQRVNASVAQMKSVSAYTDQCIVNILEKMATTEDLLHSLEHSVEPVIAAVTNCERKFAQGSPYLPDGDPGVSDVDIDAQTTEPEADEGKTDEPELDIFNEDTEPQEDSKETEPTEATKLAESPESGETKAEDKDEVKPVKTEPEAAEPVKETKQPDKQAK